ncbi:bifunctional phosphopantothenoylcysteine decarboxylase/phosphopantothenate--cysteine ligase CoaBC [Rhodohalobacter barkolensis]|uniref:Coenzyme A biosynthesis bifunctional protein CoaBC n=1 Tax=Rhodohalobacter barkolensis TaxID=2053187 RepID=A0A2N0VJ63_9BACT|nr:bifunctional phosphopantothenoylcysteine decarboxylase/phosphopantothenate--cysteine ligase CoaBC [Rhodohalobacter barkolensis]PKD44227.1 bifunctional phosphopantothenoylcysteine decarboxylase/phosphopantothenate--cysteine ligase CoaBC [Rhodohalobacter barkolensis]
MLSGKRIILGVTGGIAAYKAVYLLREFQKAGAEIRVTMTPSATRFVGSETFAALSRNEVAVEVFNDSEPGKNWTKHIHWGEWADLFVIAPCTANTLSKIVHGQSDNMLTSTLLAARCPVLICPTMDGEMYESPAVSKNLKEVREMGYYVLEPDEGYLASGLEAIGRLPESDAILKRSAQIIKEHRIQGPLTGKKVVVTAGPTREYIDPVRFISNPSSGKMGIAMADAARALGADVTLLHGPITEKIPDRIQTKSFISADDLFELMKDHQDADIVIKSAAVSDFKPVTRSNQKEKKDRAKLSVELERNPDILSWLGEHKKKGQVLIGFAMETENLMENARAKLEKKNLDWICANSLSEKGSGFASDTNTIHLIGHERQLEFTGSKKEIASQILQEIFGS